MSFNIKNSLRWLSRGVLVSPSLIVSALAKIEGKWLNYTELCQEEDGKFSVRYCNETIFYIDIKFMRYEKFSAIFEIDMQ